MHLLFLPSPKMTCDWMQGYNEALASQSFFAIRRLVSFLVEKKLEKVMSVITNLSILGKFPPNLSYICQHLPVLKTSWKQCFDLVCMSKN
jgi:hypothetical protein